MNWLSRLLGKGDEPPASPQKSAGTETGPANPFAGLEGIRFGRYSDNNKTRAKTAKWYEAEELFKEKKYTESFAALFDYIRDDKEENAGFEAEGDMFRFHLFQGSKQIRGSCDGTRITAGTPMALMDTPGTAVMRRLLEMNFSLYYSRCAMKDDHTLCMLFDTDIASATPSKLYFGLRELATKADRQDDRLLADFPGLKPAGTAHIRPLPQAELEAKYSYFKQWVSDTLRRAGELNQDSFSGAISYLLLGLLCRIDFLISPEGKLLAEIEKISTLYWTRKEEIPLIERNQMMKDACRKLADIDREAFAASVYHVKSTFAVAPPPQGEKVKEHIYNANRDAGWYENNKFPDLALVMVEYGMTYNPFIFSMPQVQTDLIAIFMAVLHADYMSALGMKQKMYDPAAERFDRAAISDAIDETIGRYREKYPGLYWDHSHLSYASLYEFAVTFSEQTAGLNLETKR